VLALVPAMYSERERQSAKARRKTVDIRGLAVCLVACLVVVVWRLLS